MEHGDVAAGERIFSKMSNRMLYDQPKDWVPAGGLPLNYEWMHGETGADNGGHPQGWNAACVMVGWRGHFGLRRESDDTYSVHVRGVRSGTVSILPLAPEHGFLHLVVLEEGTVRVTRVAQVADTSAPELAPSNVDRQQPPPVLDTVRALHPGVSVVCLNPVRIQMHPHVPIDGGDSAVKAEDGDATLLP
jgi:hypothetical protein